MVAAPLMKSVVEPLVTTLREGVDTPDNPPLSDSGETEDDSALRRGVKARDARVLSDAELVIAFCGVWCDVSMTLLVAQTQRWAVANSVTTMAFDMGKAEEGKAVLDL